jgi:hypothetical protein
MILKYVCSSVSPESVSHFLILKVKGRACTNKHHSNDSRLLTGKVVVEKQTPMLKTLIS